MDLAPFIEEMNAFIAFVSDPESDPALIFTVEERHGVTFE